MMKKAAYLLITIIGLYGLLTAPGTDSDSGEALKKELDRNQEYLQNQYSAQNTVMENDKADTLSDVYDKEKRENITIIGDSVVLGAALALKEAFPEGYVDAEESRQVKEVLEILRNLEEEGKLGSTVIIALGMNGYFYESTGQEIVDYLGTDRKICWINVYGSYSQSQDATNEVIRNLVEHNENMELIDWNSEGPKHPDWFYRDGIHLNETGQRGFAEFICEILDTK